MAQNTTLEWTATAAAQCHTFCSSACTDGPVLPRRRLGACAGSSSAMTLKQNCSGGLMKGREEIERLLSAWQAGNTNALDTLVSLVYGS